MDGWLVERTGSPSWHPPPRTPSPGRGGCCRKRALAFEFPFLSPTDSSFGERGAADRQARGWGELLVMLLWGSLVSVRDPWMWSSSDPRTPGPCHWLHTVPPRGLPQQGFQFIGRSSEVTLPLVLLQQAAV